MKWEDIPTESEQEDLRRKLNKQFLESVLDAAERIRAILVTANERGRISPEEVKIIKTFNKVLRAHMSHFGAFSA